jgi:NADP-dependent 3-hydroxy acid dehydrogenase YdfG
MSVFSGKRYWLVGGSDGLGLALARQMRAEGAELVISARDATRLASVCAELGAQAVPMDIADGASVAEAVEGLGPLDGVVLLAAVYWPMAAQKLDAAKLVAMCDVNLTGTARVLGAVLPAMLERGRGHIVLTGSLAGYRGLPGAMGYAASKAGAMVLAESLYADLRGSGIKVQLANPGFIQTRLTAQNRFSMPFIMTPDQAAGHMLRLMRSDRFKSSFPAPFSWLFRYGQGLPDWLWYRMFPRG